MEATLPSWVKCTDPIPREILEEVRSTVLVWMKNVRNYVEETETYILNDEHAPPEVVDDEWALVVERDLCFDPHLRVQFFRHAYYEDTEQNAQHIEDDYAEGVGRFATAWGAWRGALPWRVARLRGTCTAWRAAVRTARRAACAWPARQSVASAFGAVAVGACMRAGGWPRGRAPSRASPPPPRRRRRGRCW